MFFNKTMPDIKNGHYCCNARKDKWHCLHHGQHFHTSNYESLQLGSKYFTFLHEIIISTHEQKISVCVCVCVCVFKCVYLTKNDP